MIAEPALVAPGARAGRSRTTRHPNWLGARAIRLEDHIVARAKAGDQRAVTQLYERNAARVYQYFLTRLEGRAQQAEDLTSDVFVRALERLHDYECRGYQFAAWLFRIARNLLVDYIRSQPRDPFLLLEDCENTPAPAGEWALDRVADRHDLARAFGRLTRDQREALELRFMFGMSVAETSALIGKTEEAVKKLQARGLIVLQRALLGPLAAAQ